MGFESFQVGVGMEILGSPMLGGSVEAQPVPLTLTYASLSSGCYIVSNVSLSHSSKLNPSRASWELIGDGSETQIINWAWDWHLRWGQSCRTEPLTCRI